MSLDFVVLGQDGAPEKTVSLDVDLHYELITSASALGLTYFQDFADYYGDAEVTIDALPSFSEQIQMLYNHTDSVSLKRFLHNLNDLIVNAIVNGKGVFAIAD